MRDDYDSMLDFSKIHIFGFSSIILTFFFLKILIFFVYMDGEKTKEHADKVF